MANALAPFPRPPVDAQRPPELPWDIMGDWRAKPRRRYAGDVRTIQTSRGYFTLSVPSNIVQALGWGKGTAVEWRIVGKDRVELSKVEQPPRP